MNEQTGHPCAECKVLIATYFDDEQWLCAVCIKRQAAGVGAVTEASEPEPELVKDYYPPPGYLPERIAMEKRLEENLAHSLRNGIDPDSELGRRITICLGECVIMDDPKARILDLRSKEQDLEVIAAYLGMEESDGAPELGPGDALPRVKELLAAEQRLAALMVDFEDKEATEHTPKLEARIDALRKAEAALAAIADALGSPVVDGKAADIPAVLSRVKELQYDTSNFYRLVDDLHIGVGDNMRSSIVDQASNLIHAMRDDWLGLIESLQKDLPVADGVEVAIVRTKNQALARVEELLAAKQRYAALVKALRILEGEWSACGCDGCNHASDQLLGVLAEHNPPGSGESEGSERNE